MTMQSYPAPLHLMILADFDAAEAAAVLLAAGVVDAVWMIDGLDEPADALELPPSRIKM